MLTDLWALFLEKYDMSQARKQTSPILIMSHRLGHNWGLYIVSLTKNKVRDESDKMKLTNCLDVLQNTKHSYEICLAAS